MGHFLPGGLLFIEGFLKPWIIRYLPPGFKLGGAVLALYILKYKSL